MAFVHERPMTGERSRIPAFCREPVLRIGYVLAAACLVSGCAALSGAAASRFADSLSAAILDEEDPELVREAVPAYLILLDSLVKSDPENPSYLGAAAQLYAAYGVAFVADNQRAEILTARARAYGAQAICAADRQSCGLDAADYDNFSQIVDQIGPDDGNALYSYCVGSLAFIRAHSNDWTAIAALPKVEHALEHLLSLKSSANAASINMYLGILSTLRPEALGGRPERGRQYFEKAIEISGGHDLSVKVEYAKGYARLMYDRDLHDRLLNEVLQAPVRQEGLTLFNTLAQRQAQQLLATAGEYF